MDIYWIKRPIPVGHSISISILTLCFIFLIIRNPRVHPRVPTPETDSFYIRDTKTLLTEKPAEQLECTCRLAQVEAQTEKYTRSVRYRTRVIMMISQMKLLSERNVESFD